jgi:ferredoxin-type protein NapH
MIQPIFWALFMLSPVLNWFRVDMIHQKIVFLGGLYPFENQYLQWIPYVFYGGVLAIAAISWVLGRLFCGWACPHNTMTEWTRPLRALVGREPLSPNLKRFFQKFPALRVPLALLSPWVSLAWTFAMSFLLVSFVVPPVWIVEQYASGSPHVALLYGQGLFVLIGLFLLYCGHDFCRTCCPYGMGQSISAYQGGKWHPMEIQFKGDIESNCKTCTGCYQACPVDIDPRSPLNLKVGQFDGCFNCGECIDACKTVHEYKKQPGLLSFRLPYSVKNSDVEKQPVQLRKSKLDDEKARQKAKDRYDAKAMALRD